ncbi:MAG: cell division protein FtsZ [Bacteroidia bacterium]
MQFEFPKNQSSIIKVIGIGGGGGNAVNNMFQEGIDGVDFMICNTDLQALKRSDVPTRVRLGVNQTEGLGAGANPEVGRKAAMETLEEVRNILKDQTKMVFITAGMGGGTGTGAAPVIAGMAKEMGILTVGIVTMPFLFEGPKRKNQAVEGAKELEKMVDTLIVIDNNNLMKILGGKVPMITAFREADKVLCNAAKGIAEIIMTEGYVNVDFADVCTVMRDGGRALMGTATAEGEGRAMKAVEAAINSPLLDNVGIEGARAIIVNISASMESLGMDETTQVVEHIQNTAGMDSNIIYGIVYDETMGENLRVTVIATHYEDGPAPLAKTQMNHASFFQNMNHVAKDEPQRKELPTMDEILFANEPEMEPEADEVELTEEQKEYIRRLNRKQREDRISKLNSKTYDIHDTESLQKLENQPAYIRKKLILDENGNGSNVKKNGSLNLSRTSLDGDHEKKFKIREQNPFLHDKAD